MVLSLASIDYQAPYVLSGSSDKHLRLIDISTGRGWSTSPEMDETSPSQFAQGNICKTCGSVPQPGRTVQQKTHEDLVRSVVLNSDFVVSGSYDHTVKASDGILSVTLHILIAVERSIGLGSTYGCPRG